MIRRQLFQAYLKQMWSLLLVLILLTSMRSPLTYAEGPTRRASGSVNSLRTASFRQDPKEEMPGAVAFPGANGKIAFARQQSFAIYDIYVMNADGTGQTNLTNSPTDDYDPAWSPDGSRIAFESGRDDVSHEIYVMNADGSSVSRLTNNSGGDTNPVWSPDGSKIAFVRHIGANSEIFTMSSSGAGQTRLTNNSARDEHPNWSPDGSRIAFHSFRDGNWEVYAMNADGTGQTNLTNNSARDDGPNWSPDSSKIVFTSVRAGAVELYTMNANGSSPTRLTNNTTVEGYPAWSPDGSRIAFESNRNNNYDIYTMNADGTGQTRLTTHPELDSLPDWQPLPTGNNAPSVTLTSPGNGSVFNAGDIVTLAATAFDNDGQVAKVEFYSGSLKLAEVTMAPYAYSADTRNVPPGTYPVHAVAIDNLGARTLSNTISVSVVGASNRPPEVSLTSPANGAVFSVGAIVTLVAQASDPDGQVVKVEFYSGPLKLGEKTVAPYTFTANTASVPPGTYPVHAVATDNRGATRISNTIFVTLQ